MNFTQDYSRMQTREFVKRQSKIAFNTTVATSNEVSRQNPSGGSFGKLSQILR
jgi:hypothetical protein